MYLKSLDIFGFKSFADKTVLQFQPGITAIVGPNGCGKSNIFDAIRWVLGEQSVRELRGGSMEDVIFGGTDKKPPLGFAEVSLTFSNADRVLPVDYNEVMVTRRLFRSGESEYLLNRTVVRLKDILELFMGTGIGAEAYSLVQQGKVDLVVSARAEERRGILDEAAGITKYKAKRREAYAKLRETEGNLLRINDVITEVKRQIASLERQADKARRYKEEFERLKEMEIRLARHELEASGLDRERIEQETAALRDREAVLSAEAASLDEEQARQTAALEALEESIRAVEAERIKLEGERDLHLRQIGFNEERMRESSEREARAAGRRRELEERLSAHRRKRDELVSEAAALDETIGARKEALEGQRERLRRVQEGLEEASMVIREEEGRILVLTSQQVSIKNQLTEVMKEIQGALARRRRLEVEQVKVSDEREGVRRRLEEIAARTVEAADRVAELKRSLEEANGRMTTLSEESTVAEGVLEDLERRRVFLVSQKEFIEKLTVQYDDIPDPVVAGRLWTDHAPADHCRGLIGKIREVRPRPEGGVEILCETKFIELDPRQIAGRLEEIDRRIVEAAAVRDELRDRVARHQRMLGELRDAVHEAAKALSVCEVEEREVRGELEKLGGEIDLVSSEMRETDASLTEARRTEEALSGRLDEVREEVERCQRRIRETQERTAERMDEREAATVAIAQMESEIKAVEEKRRGQEEGLRMLNESIETAEEELRRMDEEREQAIERTRRYEEEIAALRTRVEEVSERGEALTERMEAMNARKREHQQRNAAVHRRVEEIQEALREVREAVHRQELEVQKIGFHEKEIKDRLLQTYRVDLDNALPGRTHEGGGDDPALEPDWDRLRGQITRLRRRCESFGSVNLVAIEEFDDLRQRFEFLTRQQSDLITAKESLHQTITKINRQTRQMFLETFTKVNDEFRVYFRMLFGGGDAHLLLLDPENVLESGVEIIARPPGKKLQNISLLSGGEKSLTAIALIFGIFKVNPSPFCILDEIDAALDEANVDRFAYLLKEFAEIAQFIVITHNKKTLAHAHAMYGVTMQETGVSRVISVKFSDRTPTPPPAERAEPAAV